MTKTLGSGPRNVARVEALASGSGPVAFVVVLFHVPGWNHALYDVAVIRNGYLMVELFFVLSGFVIFRTYSTRLVTIGDLARFQFLRFGRLYPVHLVMLLLYLGLEVLKLVAERHFGLRATTSAAFVGSDWGAFVQHLLLVQAIGPLGRAETFNIPAWSISVEFYTYLIFGSLLLLLRRRHLLMGVGLTVSVVCLGLLATGHTHGWQYLMRGVGGFFLGCGISYLTEVRCVTLPRGASVTAAVVLVLFLALKRPHQADVAVFGFAALLVLCLVADGDAGTPAALTSRALRWLGEVSYSLYMTHALVLWIANQTLRVVLKAPVAPVDGVLTPQLPIAEALVAMFVSLAASLLVAWAMSALVERPWRSRSRRVVGAPNPPGLPVVGASLESS